MTLTTQCLTDILDEAERFTVHDAGRVIVAAKAVRAFGPMPEPPKWWMEESAVDAERASAERAFSVGQRAHVGVPDLPLLWSIDYHLDGATILCCHAMHLLHVVDPDATPADFIDTMRARITTEASNAAADWRAQSADLLARATLAERLAFAMFPTPEPTP